MAVLSTSSANLLDHAKRTDPSGKIAVIVELLSQTNEVLADMKWIEGNLPTGHRTTVRTGLPAVAWRLLNQGVLPSKSTTAQIDEQCGMLEAWSEVDVDLVKLNGEAAPFRYSEAQAFLEAMNQEMAGTLFYGNSGIAPEEFTGLAPRYSSSTAGNGQNVILGGGSGPDTTSMWLAVWGPNTVTGIFPKGSTAGLQHDDYGEETVEATAGMGGARLRAYRERFQWKAGIALRDWRYVVRIANLDVSDLAAQTGTQLGGATPAATRLQTLMAKALHRIPSLGMGSPAFYANRSVIQALDIQSRADIKDGGGLTYDNVDGKRIIQFRGIPVRVTDALLENETVVT